MLRIKKIDIILEKSELIYSIKFTKEQFEKDFDISNGSWEVDGDYLVGYMVEDGGGLIYSKKHYLGDVLLDFYAKR